MGKRVEQAHAKNGRGGAAGPHLLASSGQRFVESQGLTRELPKMLLLKPNGQPFQEIQLGLTMNTPNQPNWLAQLELLLREEPVGGWEGLLNENATLLRDQVVANLSKRLAEPGRDESVKQFLADAVEAGEKLKREVDAQQREFAKHYEQLYVRLHKWQQEYGKDKNWLNRLLNTAQALLGSQVSVYEAGQLFNRRETHAKWRDALSAASQLLAGFLEAAGGYARNLDALVMAARQAAAQTRAQYEQRTSELANAHPWTYAVDAGRVASILSADDHDPALLAELLAAVRESGSERLHDLTLQLAQRDVDQRLAGRDIVSLVELEAQALHGGDGAENEFDPVVLVGERLLDQVTWEHPTWQLVKQARPRHETVQITPTGSAVFEHPDLKTARYGERNDRLGFFDVQLDIALNELKLIREGAETFQQARQQREYFVLEQLVTAFPVEPTRFGDADGFGVRATEPPSAPTPAPLPTLAGEDGREE